MPPTKRSLLRWENLPWRGALTYALLIAYSILVLAPLIITFVSSIQPSASVMEQMLSFSWRGFVAAGTTLENYLRLFEEYGFGRVLFNSFIVSLVTVVGGVFVNGMAGFAFAQFRFPGRDLLFALVLITFMVPFEVIAIPLYQLAQDLHLVNTYWGLILPGVSNGLVVFLFRQFYLGLPQAIFESARIDGASWLTVFLRVVMPLSKPVTVSASILLFITQWNSFFYPLLVANTESYRVIQVAIGNFFTQYETLWGLLFAATVLGALVPLILIVPLQRHYVAAVTGSGLKE